MVIKTIKQIKNLKAYKNLNEDQKKEVAIWTAKLINGTWSWGWYYLEDFEKNNDDYFDNLNNPLEYDI